MSRIIVYRSQEELLSEIIKMDKKVKDIERLITEKEKEWNSHVDNLNIDSMRSSRPGSSDVPEPIKNALTKLYTDIKNMKNEAAAIRMSIKVMKKDWENVKKAAKSDPARGQSPISNKTSISNPFVIIKNEMSPKDVKYIFINNENLDKRSVASLKAINDHMQSVHMQSVNTLYDAFVAAKASSSATRRESSSSPRALSPAARRASSSVSRALSPAARRASSSASGASSSASGASSSASGAPSSASRASSPSSKTYGLRKRRGKI